MTFPVYFDVFGTQLHPHLVMELLAYAIGFQLYLFLRRRWRGPSLPIEQNMWLIVGCVFGALAGSKLLAFIESASDYIPRLHDPRAWIGGKTIVGGLLGGWIGVEIVKKYFRITQRTGDLFVFPLIVGMCIGRVGCFLTGLADHTHGVHTSLPWGIDFGDGPRHPTQLYEIAFLLLTGLLLVSRMRYRPPSGEIFRLFMLAYLTFRFFVEFIKPRYTPLAGLSAIQIASLAGGFVCVWSLCNLWRHGSVEAPIGGNPAMAMEQTHDQPRWEELQRLESWAGEVRVNMIRLLGIVLFYGRHLFELYFSSPRPSESYHLRVTWVTLFWAAEVIIIHWLYKRRRITPELKYLAVAWDLAMVAALCMIAGGPKTPLVLLFFLVIATGPLRLSLPLIYFTTAGAIISYLGLLAYYAWYRIGFKKYYSTPELRIPRAEEVMFILSLLLAGFLAGQAVRQCRRIATDYAMRLSPSSEQA